MLTDLRVSFQEPGKAGAAKVEVLCGLGGVGKTQIALEYAYQHLPDYTHIFWLNADSKVSLRSGFGEITKRLGLPEAVLPDLYTREIAAKRWLAVNDGWLLILDNADTPDELNNELVGNPLGHVLVTSRAKLFDVIGVAAPRAVGVLPPTESVAFLLSRTGRPETTGAEAEAAQAIAEELGGLPLALEQAGAYISSRQTSFENYLAAYRTRRLKVLERARPVVGGYRETVATTWALNLDAVRVESQAAIDVLRLSAFLHPDAIPFELLVMGAQELSGEIATSLRDFYADGGFDLTQIDELLFPLTRYSLIDKHLPSQTYSLHRLVHEVMKADLDLQAIRELRGRLVKALCLAFPIVAFEVWPLCGRLLFHAITLLSEIPEEELNSPEAGCLLHRVGHFLEQTGDLQLAASVYQKAIKVREQVLGGGHADLGTTINNFGLVLFKLGRFCDAEVEYRRALAIRTAAQGEEHEDVAQTWNNLGMTLIELGKLRDGEECYRKAQAVYAAAGENCELVSTICMNNLAGLLHRRDQTAEAERLIREVIKIRLKLQGDFHPEVAAAYINLAIFCGERGAIDEGLEWVTMAIKIQEATIGGLHPDYGHSMEVLGNFLSLKKRFEDAKKAFHQAGDVIAASFGPKHPKIGILYINLGHCYDEEGNTTQAVKYYTMAVGLLKATVGPDHLDTASALNNLASCHLRNRDGPIAKALYTRVLEIRRNVLGETHNDVAVALSNLALIESRVGDTATATKLYEETFGIYERLNFPRTNDCRNFLKNYVSFLKEVGRGEDAEGLAAKLNGYGDAH